MAVLLQAMKEEPAEGAKCKDKFLVQAVPVSRGQEGATVSQIVCGTESRMSTKHANFLTQFDQTAKSDVVERKIRVVFIATDASSEKANESVRLATILIQYI